jgi:ubiquitin-protein ligase
MSASIENIYFEINGYKFIMNKNNDYYIISIDGTKLDWIDTINIYSINKKPTKEKLLDKIKKKLNSNDVNLKLKNIKKEETIEAKIFRELERLKKLSYQNNNINIKSVKKIFNDNTVRDIIINEYIKIWQKNSKIINISISDNIYIWNVIYNLNSFEIHMNILFDSTYYPYTPPQIRFISPKLLNKLDHRISNCKLFKLEYWNPVTNINEIINKIYEILYKNAKIDSNIIDTKINKDLYQKLLILSSYIQSEDDNEFDSYFNITKYISDIPIKKIKTNDKFNGTGYRIGDNKWKIEDYENIQKTKEFELISILTGIETDLAKINKDELYHTIENSLLIKFLVETFNNTSLLDISNRIELFKLCFAIVQHLCLENLVILIFDNKYNLFQSIKKLYESSKLSAKFDQSNEIFTQIMFVWSMIEPLQEYYIILESANKNVLISNNINNNTDINTDINKNQDYINKLQNYRFDTSNIINSNYKQSYLNALNSSKTSNQCMKRLSSEIPTLANDLPIDSGASIFLRVDENNPRAMRALITGPPDTPYDSGIFIFDIYLPPNYPTDVPMVNFTNTGGKRFNPNLYNCGKVCLSILGTYVGPAASQTEKWNTTSTLYQVLLSIQGQILVEQPYFNEPGYQASYKTADGTKKSDEYNKNIKLYTFQHAILDLLENNKFQEFKDIIDLHFKLKKERIIKLCLEWSKESNNNANYKIIAEKIISKL